ncbi:MAG: hypothetical protein ACTSP9_06900 [Promethearchaeota archaeon]
MEVFKALLTELSQSLRVEILDYYQRFYSYTLDLLEHKNVEIETLIIRNNEEQNIIIINSIVETIASALNSIGISSTSIDFKDNLTKEFLIVNKSEVSNYKELFEFVGQKTIDMNLFNIIFEFILDIDTEKLDNLDLFDLLPDNFKSKIIDFKKNLLFQDKEKIKVKSLYPSIAKIFNPTSLKIRDESYFNNNADVDILKKLHEAKEQNIEALKNPVLHDTQLYSSIEEQNDFVITPELSYKSLNGEYYFDLFGNLPILKSEVKKILKIDLSNLKSIAIKPEFLDLESLFYYISIYKIIGLPIPFKTEEIINILARYISGKIFSTGMYHISNPISNFFGLSIISELKLINDIEIIDLLDIEMFLENELKLYLPQKLLLNYFTLLSLRILEKRGIILMEKKHLLSEQINFKQINKSEKSLPLDLLCQLSLIKLLDDKTDLSWFKASYKEPLKLLISKKGLVNDNLTDSARVLLIFKILGINSKDDSSVNILLNSIISNADVFQASKKINNFHWSNDKWALKVELRMVFWFLIVLLQYEHMFEVKN